jgi:hypothetical protein
MGMLSEIGLQCGVPVLCVFLLSEQEGHRVDYDCTLLIDVDAGIGGGAGGYGYYIFGVCAQLMDE